MDLDRLFMDAADDDPELQEIAAWPTPSAGPRPSFTCPDCRAVSYHPEDVKHGYCGRCHRWTGVPDDPTPRDTGDMFTCPRCGATSTDELDLIERYCQRCGTTSPDPEGEDGPSWTLGRD